MPYQVNNNIAKVHSKTNAVELVAPDVIILRYSRQHFKEERLLTYSTKLHRVTDREGIQTFIYMLDASILVGGWMDPDLEQVFTSINREFHQIRALVDQSKETLERMLFGYGPNITKFYIGQRLET